MKANDILPDAACIGYYWMSDAADPVLIGNEDGKQPGPLPFQLIETLDKTDANPFVVEAQLFFPKEKLSVGIRYVDGAYRISRKKVTKEDIAAGNTDMVTLKKYVAHRMPGKRLLFLQYWEPVADKLCAGQDVLQPTEMAFIGFESIKTEKGK